MNNLSLKVIFSALDKVSAPFNAMSKSVSSLSGDLAKAKSELSALERQAKTVDAWKKSRGEFVRTSNALEHASKELEQARVAFDALEKPTKEQTKAFNALQQKVIDLSFKKKNLREQSARLNKELKAGGIDTQHLKKAQTDLAASMDNANKKLQRQQDLLANAAQRQRKFNEAKAAYSKSLERSQTMRDEGAAALGAGVATGAAVAAPVVTFAKAEQASMDLRVSMMKTGGAVSDEFTRINELANRLGDRLPGTTAEFQEMMTALIQQGMSAKAILGGLGEATAYLGVQLKLPKNEAAVFASKLQDATRTTEKDMMGLMDVIQRAYYLGMAPDSMREGFAKISPALSILRKEGLAATKELAPLLVMADQAAMAGEAAGNAYRKIFQMSMGTDKVAEANEMMKKRGIKLDFTNGKGEFGGIDKLFSQMEKLKSLTTEERLPVLKKIFGDDAETLQVLTLLITKGQAGYNQTIQRMKQQADLQTRVNAQLGTLVSLWDAATGSFSNALVSVGASIAPELKQITVWLADVAQGMRNWADANPGLANGLMKFLGILALLLTTLGSLALGLGAILGPLALARMAFVGMGFAMAATPIGWIIGGITVIAGLAALLITNWDTVSAWWSMFWKSCAGVLDATWQGFKAVFNWSPLDAISSAFKSTMDWFAGLEDKFAGFGGKMIDALINGIREKMNQARQVLSDLGSEAIAAFKETMGIASPSKVMARMGDETVNGLVQGVTRSAPGAQNILNKQTQRLAGVALLTAAAAPAAASNTAPGAAQGIVIHISAPLEINLPAGAVIDPEHLRRIIREEGDRHASRVAAAARAKLGDRY